MSLFDDMNKFRKSITNLLNKTFFAATAWEHSYLWSSATTQLFYSNWDLDYQAFKQQQD
jgi:hypothetical protein